MAAKRKLPISRDHIRLAINQYHHKNSSYDDKLWLAQFVCGFDALLRVAEFTMPDNEKVRNWKKYTRRASVRWLDNNSSFSFLLPGHKADTTFEGNKIIINSATAVNVFRAYLAARDKTFPIHLALWVRCNGRVPTRDWFVKKLRLLIPDKDYAGQSL